MTGVEILEAVCFGREIECIGEVVWVYWGKGIEVTAVGSTGPSFLHFALTERERESSSSSSSMERECVRVQPVWDLPPSTTSESSPEPSQRRITITSSHLCIVNKNKMQFIFFNKFYE